MSNKSQKNRTKKEKKIKEVGQSQMSPPSMPDSPYNRGPVNGGHYRLENAKTPDRYVNLEESLEVEMAKMIALLEKKTAEMSQALDEGDPAEATRGDPHPARMFWFPVKDEFSDKFPNKVNVMGQSKKNKYVDLSKGIPEDRDEDNMNPKKPKNQGMSEDTAQSDKGKNILNESQRFLKQYKITSENIDKSDVADAYISPDDPINELKIIQYLAGLNAESRLAEYREHQKQINKGSNISVTAEEKAKIMKENNIQPGTPEWFRLWFSLPFMTGEKPIDKET